MNLSSFSEVDEPRAYYTSEVSQKEKNKYILMHIYGIQKNSTDEPIYREMEMQM